MAALNARRRLRAKVSVNVLLFLSIFNLLFFYFFKFHHKFFSSSLFASFLYFYFFLLFALLLTLFNSAVRLFTSSKTV